MISIMVDECYAFDYLSILEIKKNISNETYDSWLNCYNYIKNQIPNLFDTIITSDEYKDLLSANMSTFKIIDLVRFGNLEITSKQVDDCNLIRYEKKLKLQKKFFPNTKIVEIKKGGN